MDQVRSFQIDADDISPDCEPLILVDEADREVGHMSKAHLFKFKYQAQFDTAGAEHELCSVFIGRCTERPRIDPNEILAWRWIGPRALQAEVSGSGAGNFTPWFILEWGRIWRDHRAAVLAMLGVKSWASL